MNIAQLMTPKVCTACLHEGSTVRQALETMQRHQYTVLPVVDDEGKYLGCVSEGDFLRHLLSTKAYALREQERFRVSDLHHREDCRPVNIRASLLEVTEVLRKQNFVPIVDDRDLFCGIVTRSSFIAWVTTVLPPDLLT